MLGPQATTRLALSGLPFRHLACRNIVKRENESFLACLKSPNEKPDFIKLAWGFPD